MLRRRHISTYCRSGCQRSFADRNRRVVDIPPNCDAMRRAHSLPSSLLLRRKKRFDQFNLAHADSRDVIGELVKRYALINLLLSLATYLARAANDLRQKPCVCLHLTLYVSSSQTSRRDISADALHE